MDHSKSDRLIRNTTDVTLINSLPIFNDFKRYSFEHIVKTEN